MKIKTIPSCCRDRLVLLSVKQTALDSAPIFSSPATPAPLPSWRMIAPPCSITISSAKSNGSKKSWTISAQNTRSKWTYCDPLRFEHPPTVLHTTQNSRVWNPRDHVRTQRFHSLTLQTLTTVQTNVALEGFYEQTKFNKTVHDIRDFSADPQCWDSLPISLPYHSHTYWAHPCLQ